MKKLLVLFLLLVIITSFGCGAAKNSESVQEPSARNEMSDTSSQQGKASLDLQAAEQKVIKNAEISITVKNNRESEAKIQELVAQYKGFIQNTESYQSKDSSVTNIEVRIPADSFESFLSALKDLGEITHNRV